MLATTLMTPLARAEGIEPPPRGLEALVLPLHYAQVKLEYMTGFAPA